MARRYRVAIVGTGIGARHVEGLLANPERLLSVTQVGVTLASLGLGWAGEDTMYHVMLKMFGGLIGIGIILSSILARGRRRLSRAAPHGVTSEETSDCCTTCHRLIPFHTDVGMRMARCEMASHLPTSHFLRPQRF